MTDPKEPIHPCTIKVPVDYKGNKTAEAMLPEFENQTLPGLTKREYYAGLFVASMLTYSTSNIKEICQNGVNAADHIINALNK